MAKLGCQCGYVMSNGAVPNEVEGMLVSDESYDTFSDYVKTVVDDCFGHVQAGTLDEWRAKHFDKEHWAVTPGAMLQHLIYKRFRGLSLDVWECERCGRLHVQEGPRSQMLRGYAPEPGIPEVPHVFAPVEDDGDDVE